jgi:hypothetical protein
MLLFKSAGEAKTDGAAALIAVGSGVCARFNSSFDCSSDHGFWASVIDGMAGACKPGGGRESRDMWRESKSDINVEFS